MYAYFRFSSEVMVSICRLAFCVISMSFMNRLSCLGMTSMEGLSGCIGNSIVFNLDINSTCFLLEFVDFFFHGFQFGFS